MAKKAGFFDFAVETDEVLASSSPTTVGDTLDDDIKNKEYTFADDVEDDGKEKDVVIPATAPKPDEGIVSAVPAVPVNDLTTMLEDIAEDLELNEMLFISDDAQYEQSVKGLKDMLKDNFVALKDKLEKENETVLQARLAELDSIDQPKFADMSTDDEGNASLMLTKWYEATGLDEEEIADKLTELNELGLLSREAKLAQKFLVRNEKEQEVQLQEARIQEEQNQKKQNEEYTSNLKKSINDTEDVLGIKPTPKQKKEFTDYLFKFDKEGKTQAMKDAEDETKRFKFAWMQFLDYKAADLSIAATTKAANDLEKRAKRFTSPESIAKGTTRREMEETTEFKKGALDWWSAGRQDD